MFLFTVFCKIGALEHNALLLFLANHLNQTSELNESANHLAKNPEKKKRKKMLTKIAET